MVSMFAREVLFGLAAVIITQARLVNKQQGRSRRQWKRISYDIDAWLGLYTNVPEGTTSYSWDEGDQFFLVHYQFFKLYVHVGTCDKSWLIQLYIETTWDHYMYIWPVLWVGNVNWIMCGTLLVYKMELSWSPRVTSSIPEANFVDFWFPYNTVV